jgi:predicted Zn-dependent peptidase
MRRPGFTLALAAAIAAAPAAVHAALEVEVLPPEPGRPRVLLARRPGPLATISISFAAGAADDGGSPGLTRLAQHALLSANQRVSWDELVLSAWTAGARLSVDTGQRTATFTLTSAAAEFLPLARQLATAVLAPRLVPARFRDAIARAVLDVGSGDAGLAGLVTAVAATDDAFRRPPHGQRGVLESLDLAEVADHVRRHLCPANATVVVTGAFSRGEVVRLLAPFRGGDPRPPGRIALRLPATERREGEREVNVIGFPLELPRAADAAAARVAVELVHAALWEDFRNSGIGYSFEASVERIPGLDVLVVALPAHDLVEGDLGERLRAVLQRVREGRFSDADLEAARSAAIADLLSVDSRPDALAPALAGGGASWHGAATALALRSLDRAGVVAALRGWLDPARSVHLYVGPHP